MAIFSGIFFRKLTNHNSALLVLLPFVAEILLSENTIVLELQKSFKLFPFPLYRYNKFENWLIYLFFGNKIIYSLLRKGEEIAKRVFGNYFYYVQKPLTLKIGRFLIYIFDFASNKDVYKYGVFTYTFGFEMCEKWVLHLFIYFFMTGRFSIFS